MLEQLFSSLVRLFHPPYHTKSPFFHSLIRMCRLIDMLHFVGSITSGRWIVSHSCRSHDGNDFSDFISASFSFLICKSCWEFRFHRIKPVQDMHLNSQWYSVFTKVQFDAFWTINVQLMFEISSFSGDLNWIDASLNFWWLRNALVIKL